MRNLKLKLTRRDDGRVCKRADGRLRIWADEETARKEFMALREGNRHAAAVAAAPIQETAGSIKLVFNGFLADREARTEILEHCRELGPHVRGCWVLCH